MKLYWRYKKNGKWTWRAAVGIKENDICFDCWSKLDLELYNQSLSSVQEEE